MSNNGLTRASYDEIIADPKFKEGYWEIWDGLLAALDIRWSEAEQRAYERGRQFGTVVMGLDEGRVPLTRGYLAHPRAKLLLVMAMRSGEVL